MIEAAIKSNGMSTFLHKGSIKKAQSMLSEREEFLHAAIANISILPIQDGIEPDIRKIKNKVSGVIVVTSKRVYFCNNVAGKGTSKQIMIKDITSIDDSVSLFKTAKLRISGITEMFVVDGNEETIQQISQAVNEARF